MSDELWNIVLHASGKYKMLHRQGESGYYYFRHPEAEVIDAVCARLNALEADLKAARERAEEIKRLTQHIIDNRQGDTGECMEGNECHCSEHEARRILHTLNPTTSAVDQGEEAAK